MADSPITTEDSELFPKPEAKTTDDRRYEIRAFIGAGGMGQVYKAWDRKLLKEVAFKVLRNTDLRAGDRALREARLQARVEDPAICRILDVGHQDGRPYIAMELIEGPESEAVLGPLDLENKLRRLLPMIRGVEAAHRAGLVHRDLKPGNILWRQPRDEDDSPGKSNSEAGPVIVDFGLARALADESAASTPSDRLTLTGQVLGTPAYMSPEQIRGEEPLDARSDIYSLGCLLFEVISGETPFRETSQIEVMISAIKKPAPRLRAVLPNVSPRLERILEKCLEKKREHRYASAAALADDLESFVDGEPTSLDESSPGTELRLWVRHHPGPLRSLLAAALVLLVAGALFGTWWHGREQRRLEAEAAQRFGVRAERLASTLRIARLNPSHDMGAAKAAARREIEDLEQEALSLGSWGLPAARYALGVASLGVGELELAQNHLEAALEDTTETPDNALIQSLMEVLIHRFAGQVERLAHLRGDMREYRFEQMKNRFLSRALSLPDLSPEAKNERIYFAALEAFANQNWEGVFAACAQALQEDSGLWQCHELRGQAHRVRGVEADVAGDDELAQAELRLAIEAFAAATTIARSDERLFAKSCLASSTLLDMELRSGDMPRQDTPESCQSAIDLDPSIADPHLAQAFVLQRQAIAEYRASRPFEAILRQAREALEKALELAKTDIRVVVETQMAVQIQIEYDLTSWHESPSDLFDIAAGHARAALALDPSYTPAHGSLAQILFNKAERAQSAGQPVQAIFEEAVEILEEGLEQAPNLVHLHSTLGIFNDWYSQVVASQGGDPGPWLAKSRADFGRAITLDPKNPTVLVNLGITYLYEAGRLFHRGDAIDSAVEAGNQVLLDAIELSPERAVLHFNRAELLTLPVRLALEHGRDPGEAMENLRKAHAFPFAQDAREYGCSQGKVEWLQTKVDHLRGQDPRPAFERGLAAIDTVLAEYPKSWRCRRDRVRLWLESYSQRAEIDAENAERDLKEAGLDIDIAFENQPANAELLRLEASYKALIAEAADEPGQRAQHAESAIASLNRAEELEPGYRHHERESARLEALARP